MKKLFSLMHYQKLVQIFWVVIINKITISPMVTCGKTNLSMFKEQIYSNHPSNQDAHPMHLSAFFLIRDAHPMRQGFNRQKCASFDALSYF